VDDVRFRPAVVDRDPHQNVVGGRFGVFHKYIKVTVVVEDAGIEQLVLGIVAAAPAVFLNQL